MTEDRALYHRLLAYENALRQIVAGSPSWAHPWQVAAHAVAWGAAAPDPLVLREVKRDGDVVIQGRCPRCEVWGDLDDDMLHGRVSTHHDVPECGYHETKDWWNDHVVDRTSLGRVQ